MSEHRLSEIVIERPRGGMRISLKKLKGFKKQLHKLTEEASEDGLLSPYLIKPRNKSKYLSDHLGPLRRFVRSHIGQPWNDVYSKLCQQLDSSTMAGQHVLDHMRDYVELHVELIDGIPHEKCRRQYRLAQRCRFKLYVHPETGILCDAKTDSQRAIASLSPSPKKQPNIIQIDAYHEYHKLNDIWYVITFQKVPATEAVFDILSRATITPELRNYNTQVYASHKRQCSKRDIKIIQERLKRLR